MDIFKVVNGKIVTVKIKNPFATRRTGLTHNNCMDCGDAVPRRGNPKRKRCKPCSSIKNLKIAQQVRRRSKKK